MFLIGWPSLRDGGDGLCSFMFITKEFGDMFFGYESDFCGYPKIFLGWCMYIMDDMFVGENVLRSTGLDMARTTPEHSISMGDSAPLYHGRKKKHTMRHSFGWSEHIWFSVNQNDQSFCSPNVCLQPGHVLEFKRLHICLIAMFFFKKKYIYRGVIKLAFGWTNWWMDACNCSLEFEVSPAMVPQKEINMFWGS